MLPQHEGLESAAACAAAAWDAMQAHGMGITSLSSDFMCLDREAEARRPHIASQAEASPRVDVGEVARVQDGGKAVISLN